MMEDIMPAAKHDDPIAEATEKLMNSVRSFYDGSMSGDAESERIRAMARAICLAARGGDPDGIVLGFPGAEPSRGGKNTVSFSGPLQPAWALYVAEARAAAEVSAA